MGCNCGRSAKRKQQLVAQAEQKAQEAATASAAPEKKEKSDGD